MLADATDLHPHVGLAHHFTIGATGGSGDPHRGDPRAATMSKEVKEVVDKRCSAVLRGVSHEGRLIGGGARDQEPDGDTRRRDSNLDRFRPSDQCNTLRPVSLVYCIEM